MKKSLTIFLFIGITFQCISQSNKTWVAVEIDPITTVFGAKTLSVILEPQKVEHWSLFLNMVSADFPKWMDDLLNTHNKDKAFDTKISIGGGFAMDYFFKSDHTGYYVGLINLVFNNEVQTKKVSGETLTHNIIPRIGYRWYPFGKSNFYINPFLGIRYEYRLKDKLIVEGEEFQAAGFGPFGTVHIGCHF